MRVLTKWMVTKWMVSTTVAMLALAVTPLLATASGYYYDNVTGAEYYASSTEGRFGGAATGALPGTWYIDVFHTALSPNATITGGTFSLTTVLSGQQTTVTGDFASGTVIQNQTSGCGNQTYQISGNLVKVGPQSSSHSGNGTFNGTLTHYRYSFYGSCVIYSASVTGHVRLNF